MPIVGQYFGQKKLDKIEQVMRQYLIIGVVLAIGSICFRPIIFKPVLGLMNLEQEVEAVAVGYLTWLSLGLFHYCSLVY